MIVRQNIEEKERGEQGQDILDDMEEKTDEDEVGGRMKR